MERLLNLANQGYYEDCYKLICEITKSFHDNLLDFDEKKNVEFLSEIYQNGLVYIISQNCKMV